MTEEKIHIVQDRENLEHLIINNKDPVVVSILSDNEPCKKIIPKLEQVIDENKGKVSLAKINISDSKRLSIDYEVQTTPILEIYKDGTVVDLISGVHDTCEIRSFIKNNINN
ncbi:hypothetical protein PVAND_015523 [Polypedilum vanderplanki]|uniref:Thioredoxin domain-containing protein n=1 Tax=Polypedilum vanderplanki TaxID=319348 RepID=A0A9J6BD88_POLVA|nr:hypothetical protein PVAND_015523 [Polypedilum vanderplanki]